MAEVEDNTIVKKDTKLNQIYQSPNNWIWSQVISVQDGKHGRRNGTIIMLQHK